jgi:hypothetical protein
VGGEKKETFREASIEPLVEIFLGVNSLTEPSKEAGRKAVNHKFFAQKIYSSHQQERPQRLL